MYHSRDDFVYHRMGQKVMPYCFAEEKTPQLNFIGVHEVIHSHFTRLRHYQRDSSTTTSAHLFERRVVVKLKTLIRL